MMTEGARSHPCPECGQGASGNFCQHCGASLGGRFCSQCGTASLYRSQLKATGSGVMQMLTHDENVALVIFHEQYA